MVSLRAMSYTQDLQLHQALRRLHKDDLIRTSKSLSELRNKVLIPILDKKIEAQNFYDLPVRSKNSENASQTQKFWF